MPHVSRRAFLITTAATGLSLTLRSLRLPAIPGGARAFAATASPAYKTFEDLYRRKWRWDRVVRGTHTNANCAALTWG